MKPPKKIKLSYCDPVYGWSEDTSQKGIEYIHKDEVAKKVNLLNGILTNCPELNMSNYDEGQVEELNNAMIEVFQIVQELRNKLEEKW